MKNNKTISEKRKKRRQKENKMLGIICGVIIILVVAVASVLNYYNKPQIAEEEEELDGLWIFDSSTSYEFLEDGRGILHVEETEYHFTYKIKREDIVINFKDDIVEDCVYGISFENGMLYLEGKTGTSGGVYELEKEISR